MAKGSIPLFSRFVRGGVKVPHNKNTASCQTVEMPCPDRVVIPMQQHIGASCKVVVKPGDAVAVGDVIGECTSYISAPVHASVSGSVVRVMQVKLANGSSCDAVEIRSDGEMRVSKNVKKPSVTNKKELVEAVFNSGLVGLGGAGFPTHVKLDLSENDTVDTLIINCSECEPYITADHRCALENTADIISGMVTVMRCLKIDRTIIGVEDNKPGAVRALSNAVKISPEPECRNVEVKKLKTRYPQGDEKLLIKVCTGRAVLMGQLPKDSGCIVMNISSVAFLGSYLKTGVPLIKKRITVDGSAISQPKNLIVPIGTLISDIIEFCGGVKTPAYKLMYGGPMMGIALPNDRFPIIKNNNAILAFGEKEAVLPEPTACIRCGRCAAHCPMHLIPEAVEKAVRLKDTVQLKKHSAEACIECGCCAYGCPAHRPLVQSMRVAKSLLKEAGSNGK